MDPKALVEGAVKRCREQEQRLRKECKQWQQIAMLLPEVEHRPFDFLSKLDTLERYGSTQTNTLTLLREWAKQKADEQLSHYGELLRAAIAGDSVQVEGRFPEYRINFILTLSIDTQTYQAEIGTRFRKVRLKNDISVTTVAETVRKEVKRLFERPLATTEFLGELFRAYELALTNDRRPARIGEAVSLFAVHRFVLWLRQRPRLFQSPTTDAFVPYLPDEFAVDIGRLLEHGTTETAQGYRLQLHPVRNPKEALFIVNFATGKGLNYGLLSFTRDQTARRELIDE